MEEGDVTAVDDVVTGDATVSEHESESRVPVHSVDVASDAYWFAETNSGGGGGGDVEVEARVGAEVGAGAGVVSAREALYRGSVRAVAGARVRADLLRDSCCWITHDRVRSTPDAKLAVTFDVATGKVAPPSYAAVASGNATPPTNDELAARCAFRLAQCAHDKDDHLTAHTWLERGLKLDSKCSIALHNLAFMSDNGVDGNANLALAVKLYMRAGLAHSLYRAGLILFFAVSNVSDAAYTFADAKASEDAIRIIEAAADAGHAEASFVAGVERARGRLRNAGDDAVERGLVHLERASKLGLAAADGEIALVHMARAHAYTVEKNDITVAGAAERAMDRDARVREAHRAATVASRHGAERDDVACQEMLGRALVRGEGCNTNATEGLRWLTAAGRAGAPSAMFDAARMIQRGLGLRKRDVERAVVMFETLTEEHDHPGAMCDLSLIVRTGYGKVEADPVRAMELLERAVEVDYAPAMAYMLVEKIVENKGDDVGRYQMLVAKLAGIASAHRHPDGALAMKALTVVGEIKACAWCLETGPFDDINRALRSCARCGTVQYCHLTCQRKAWPTHKDACAALSETPEEGSSATATATVTTPPEPVNNTPSDDARD